jgi:hypothetical protein
MSHTLRSLDAEWRRLTRTSRARRALRQWSIAHPALRGLADLDELLERRRDDTPIIATRPGPPAVCRPAPIARRSGRRPLDPDPDHPAQDPPRTL